MLRAYPCGRTSHRLDQMFRGGDRVTRYFPSNVFLYEGGGRRMLFDTGYAALPWDAGVGAGLYRRILPPEVTPAETAAAQLLADGIDPQTITHVVLSHLHPDHIGGLRDFPNATLVMTEGLAASAQRNAVKDGILDGLLPADFDTRPRMVAGDASFARHPVLPLQVSDPFGDPNFLLVDLPGHARGHVGALVHGAVLLAGDAAWGADLLSEGARMRALPRFIQHDANAYVATSDLLAELPSRGVRVVCSHDVGVPAVVVP